MLRMCKRLIAVFVSIAMLFTSISLESVAKTIPLESSVSSDAMVTPSTTESQNSEVVVMGELVEKREANIKHYRMKAVDFNSIVYSYKIGNATPTGYVHIWSKGQANFAIDNVRIVNKDKEGKVIDVDYQSGKMTGTEDYVYEPKADVYLKADAESGFNWTMLMVYAVITGIVIYGIFLIVAKGKKTPKKKEGNADET